MRKVSSWLSAVVPGLLLTGLLAVLAGFGARAAGFALGFERTPLSPILVAVLLGLGVRNSVGVHRRFGPGLDFCVSRLLRIGVALLGIRLSLIAVADIGVMALPLVVACIAAALVVVHGLARALRLPPRLGSLIAAGTSICGITAIVAVAPVIGADEDETSYAVAIIALFGMGALLLYPWVAHALFADPRQAGLFLGTAIHDTSQVVGAGLAYQHQYGAAEALDTAVVTKLLRNLAMIAVIPLMALLHRRRATTEHAADGEGRPGLQGALVPLFVLGFLAMVLLRTAGEVGERPFGLLSAEDWSAAVAVIQGMAEVLLLLAMVAVGLRTSLRRLYALGARALAVGLAAALTVGGVAALLIR